MKRERKIRIDFEQLRRTVPITAVLEKYGLLREAKQSGTQLKMRCPIHGSTTSRSLVVDPNKGVWKCFSPSCSSQGGGMLEFVAAMEKVDVQKAAVLVARWFAIKPTTVSNRRTHRRVK